MSQKLETEDYGRQRKRLSYSQFWLVLTNYSDDSLPTIAGCAMLLLNVSL